MPSSRPPSIRFRDTFAVLQAADPRIRRERAAGWQNVEVDAMFLHCATRRYLIDRFDALSRRYAERVYDVTNPEAKRIYPRYNLVADILEQVERLDPDDLPDTESLAEFC